MQRVKIKISLQWKPFLGRVLKGPRIRMAREHLFLRNEEAGGGVLLRMRVGCSAGCRTAASWPN